MSHKIMVNCGHGTTTDGKWDPGTTYGKYTEAGLMLPITKAAVKYLRASGITVLSDADTGNDKNIVVDVAWANREKVEIYVSVHCDYPPADPGVMPLYYSAEGKKIASALNTAIKSGMGMKSRGCVRRTDDLMELESTDMPAVILETGAIKADLAILRDESDQYGKCIAKGICNYLGVTFKETTTATKTVANTATTTTTKTSSTTTTAAKHYYRVRKSWNDKASQVGAYEDLNNAKDKADETGYTVYDWNGKKVYVGRLYRIRKSWTDEASQLGAYSDLAKAKAACDKNAGYHVYDWTGKLVYTSTAKTTAAKTTKESANLKARKAAAQWAVEKAADPIHMYGTGKRAHRYGCPYCGTNAKKKGTSKVKVNGKWWSYENTMCCNPFVHSAYSHGAGDPAMLKACKAGSGIGTSADTFTRYGCWKKLGKVAKAEIGIGDVLVKEGHHVAIYTGDGNITHAAQEGWTAKSIRTETLTDAMYKKYSYVMRYTGTGKF